MRSPTFAPLWVKCVASFSAMILFMVAVIATCLDATCWWLCPITAPAFYSGLSCIVVGRPTRPPSEALIRTICELVEHRRR